MCRCGGADARDLARIVGIRRRKGVRGVAPDLDLHCARVNASAKTMFLKPNVSVEEMVGMTREGMAKFPADTTLYVRPMYWAERPGPMALPPDPDSTRFALTLYDAPMRKPDGFSVTLSPFRRPTQDSAPVDAKAGCLYPNNARAMFEAKSRGFDNCLVRDMLGNIASSPIQTCSRPRTTLCTRRSRTARFSPASRDSA